MAARSNSQLAVKAEEQAIEQQQSTSLTRRKKQTEELAPAEQAQAIALEELNISFDPDTRLAIIQRLVREHADIKTQSTQELQLAKALEIARLASIESARQRGVQEARAEAVAKRKLLLEQTKEKFIKQELPQLLDACEHLPYETMQKFINNFAERLGIKLQWEEIEGGEFKVSV
jgi:hypothetical protein